MRNALEGKVTDEKLFLLAQKSSVAKLSRKFGVNRQTITAHIKKHESTLKTKSPALLDAPITIENLGISKRTKNAMLSSATSVAELSRLTVADILARPGFGQRMVDELKAALAKKGLHLKNGSNGAGKSAVKSEIEKRSWLVRAGAGEKATVSLDVQDLYVVGVGFPLAEERGCVLEIHIKASVVIGESVYAVDGNVDFKLDPDDYGSVVGKGKSWRE